MILANDILGFRQTLVKNKYQSPLLYNMHTQTCWDQAKVGRIVVVLIPRET